MRILVSLTTTFLSISGAYAANDWNVPCTQGICQYDLVKNGVQSGTLKIWGPPTSIIDITHVAGWHILECAEDAMEQIIRLVCISSSLCSHLFSHKGAEGKIVRLPEKCGGSPFARIKKAWVHENQDLPHELLTWLWKRDGQLPSVHGLDFDTNFHEIDPTEAGPIRFAIQATTNPNTENEIDTHFPSIGRPDLLVERSHEDIIERSIGSIRKSIGEHVNIPTPDDVKSAVTSVANNVMEEAKKKFTDVENDVEKDVQSVRNAVKKPFYKHGTIKFGPKHVDRNITLYKQTINCPPFYPGVEIDLNPYGTFQGTVGFAVSGTIVPPHIADYSVVANFSAEIEATLVLLADVMFKQRILKKTVFEAGLPHLRIPGIMTIEPKFSLGVSSSILMDIAVGTRIPLGYHVHNAEIIFPARKGHNTTIQSSGLKGEGQFDLKASPFARSYARLDGHIIPTINLDMSAFNKSSSVKIVMDIMVALKLELEVDGKYRKVKTYKKRELEDFKTRDFERIPDDDMFGAKGGVALHYGAGRQSSKLSVVSKRPPKAFATPSLNKRASPAPPASTDLPVGPGPWPGGYSPPPNVDFTKDAFNGCIQTYIYFEIGVTTDGWLPKGIFDSNNQYTPFWKYYPLYQKCIGTSQPPPPPPHIFKDLGFLDIQSRGHTPQPVSSLVKRSKFHNIKCLSTTIGAAVGFASKYINLSTTRPL